MKISLALLFASLTLASATAAHADDITFTGTATGYFGSTPGTESLGGLSYTGNTFTTTTSGGYASFSGAQGSFGSFTLVGATENYSGNFTLDITFTTPAGINGGQSTTFNDIVTGSVTHGGAPGGGDSGGVEITYNNPVQSFTFPGGSFTLTVDDEFVQPDTTVRETAGVHEVSVAATPEPSSLALLGTGLVGAAGMARRKFRRG